MSVGFYSLDLAMMGSIFQYLPHADLATLRRVAKLFAESEPLYKELFTKHPDLEGSVIKTSSWVELARTRTLAEQNMLEGRFARQTISSVFRSVSNLNYFITSTGEVWYNADPFSKSFTALRSKNTVAVPDDLYSSAFCYVYEVDQKEYILEDRNRIIHLYKIEKDSLELIQKYELPEGTDLANAERNSLLLIPSPDKTTIHLALFLQKGNKCYLTTWVNGCVSSLDLGKNLSECRFLDQCYLGDQSLIVCHFAKTTTLKQNLIEVFDLIQLKKLFRLNDHIDYCSSSVASLLTIQNQAFLALGCSQSFGIFDFSATPIHDSDVNETILTVAFTLPAANISRLDWCHIKGQPFLLINSGFLYKLQLDPKLELKEASCCADNSKVEYSRLVHNNGIPSIIEVTSGREIKEITFLPSYIKGFISKHEGDLLLLASAITTLVTTYFLYFLAATYTTSKLYKYAALASAPFTLLTCLVGSAIYVTHF